MPSIAHSGVLISRTPTEEPWSVTRSEGAVFIRSASSAEPEPADWRQRLTAYLRTRHSVVAVGAKRLGSDGNILSMGDFVVHPKGFHHLGRGVDPVAYRFPEEVDAVCGGVLAVDESAFDRAGGMDRLNGPLGSIQLCLALRSAGGKCIVVPEVIVCDTFSPLEEGSVSPADDEAFRAKWGFDWRAADLGEVRQRHADSGLMWNVRFFGQAMPFAKYDDRPCMHWKSYAEVDVYRQRADNLTQIVRDAAPKDTPPARILDLGCGDGLFTHLLAKTGVQAIGIDAESGAVAQAAARTAREAAGGAYPGPAPEFLTGRGEALPFESDSMHTVAMLDVIEHLPNPVSVLREVQRVLLPGGLLVISTPAWQFGGSSDPVYHLCEYTLPELVQQIHAATELRVLKTGRIGAPYRDLIVAARK